MSKSPSAKISGICQLSLQPPSLYHSFTSKVSAPPQVSCQRTTSPSNQTNPDSSVELLPRVLKCLFAPALHLLHSEPRRSEVTPSLRFTFSRSKHPQQHPQQRHRWCYSYRRAELCSFKSLLWCSFQSTRFFEPMLWKQTLQLLGDLPPGIIQILFCLSCGHPTSSTQLCIDSGHFSSPPLNAHTHTQNDTTLCQISYPLQSPQSFH